MRSQMELNEISNGIGWKYQMELNEISNGIGWKYEMETCKRAARWCSDLPHNPPDLENLIIFQLTFIQELCLYIYCNLPSNETCSNSLTIWLSPQIIFTQFQNCENCEKLFNQLIFVASKYLNGSTKTSLL